MWLHKNIGGLKPRKIAILRLKSQNFSLKNFTQKGMKIRVNINILSWSKFRTFWNVQKEWWIIKYLWRNELLMVRARKSGFMSIAFAKIGNLKIGKKSPNLRLSKSDIFYEKVMFLMRIETCIGYPWVSQNCKITNGSIVQWFQPFSYANSMQKIPAAFKHIPDLFWRAPGPENMV